MDMDTGSLLEEGISQHTLNELLGLADELDFKDVPYSPTLDLAFPPVQEQNDPPVLTNPLQNVLLPNSSRDLSGGQTPIQKLTVENPVANLPLQSCPPNVLSQNVSVTDLTRHNAIPLQQYAATLPCIVSAPNVAQIVQSGQASSLVQHFGGQVVSQGQVLQQAILASSLRQTPSPILSVNAPRSSSPLIIRPQQILPKPGQQVQPAAPMFSSGSPNLQMVRAPSPHIVTPVSGIRGAIVQQGAGLVIPSGIRLQTQPLLLNTTGHRTLNLNQNVLNTNVLNALQNQLQPNLLSGNLQSAQFVQNTGTFPATSLQTPQFQNVQQTGTFVQAQPAMTIQSSQILQNQQLAHGPQILDNLHSFPNLNLNSSGNHVNLLNLNAQPGSQIVIHGNPTSSQGGIILGAIPGPVLQMNTDGQNSQKIFVNSSNVPMQSGGIQPQNLVLNVGGSGLNLQGTSVQAMRPMGQPQLAKPMANVVGQRQADLRPNQPSNDDIMSKAMSMSAIEIDDDEDDIIMAKNQSQMPVSQLHPRKSNDVRYAGPSTSGSVAAMAQGHSDLHTTDYRQVSMPTLNQAGLAVDSKIQTVIPLSPQIQNALQKVQAEIRNLQSRTDLDQSLQVRLDTLLQVQSKIIQHAKDQAAKLKMSAEVQSDQITQSDSIKSGQDAARVTNSSAIQNAFAGDMQPIQVPASAGPKPDNRIGEAKPMPRRPVATIAPMQPRTVASVIPMNHLPEQAKRDNNSVSNLATLLNAPTTVPLRLNPVTTLSLSSTCGSMPVSSAASDGPVPTTNVPLTTSIGGIKTIGIVKASDISSPTGLVPDVQRPNNADDPQMPVQTTIKVGTHVLKMSLTQEQKSRIESHLSKLTPQQQEAVFTHQQALLARSQKIQLKAMAMGPNAKPLILPYASEGVQATVVSSNPLTLKLLSQPSTSSLTSSTNSKLLTSSTPLRGTKRPSSLPLQTTQPSKIAMMRQELENDRRAVVTGRGKSVPFRSWLDICQRLSRYHVCTDMEIPEHILHQEDMKFEEESIALADKSRSLMNQFRESLLLSSMKEPLSPERVMVERMFLEEEKDQFKKDQELATKHPELFIPRLVFPLTKPPPTSPPSDSDSFFLDHVTDEHVISSDTEPGEMKAVRMAPPSDDLNRNLQLSPVSCSSPQNYDIPSFGWASSPSESVPAPRAPLRLVLRKSVLGFQNISSPVPPRESDEEASAGSDDNHDSSGNGKNSPIPQSLDDDDQSDQNDEDNYDDSASTEVEASPAENAGFTSEYGRQISQGFEEISDDECTVLPSTRTDNAYPPDGDNYFAFTDPVEDFLPDVDLGDQMQTAIDSILSLQQTGGALFPKPSSAANSTEDRHSSRDDLDAAVQSILF